MNQKLPWGWLGGLCLSLHVVGCGGEPDAPPVEQTPARPILAEESWRPLGGSLPNTLSALSGLGDERFAVGSAGAIWHSSDAGKTWQEHPRHGTSTETLYGVLGRSADDIVAVGNRGTLLHSTDGGDSWRAAKSPTQENLNGVFLDGNAYFAVGNNGVVLRSEDGDAWSLLKSGTHEDLESGAQSPSGLVVVGRSGVILRSRDHGQSWQSLSSNTRRDLKQVAALGERDLYAVGGEPGAGLILSSTDGGDSWRLTKGDGTIAFSLAWTSASSAYFLGFGNTILRSSDHGASLLAAGRGCATAACTGAAVTPGGVFFLSDANGKLFRSTDRATTWNTLSSPQTESLSALWFANESRGFAVGYRGEILRTNDGGTSWESRQDGTSGDLRAVTATKPGEAFAGGAGALLHTQDGGQTWRSPVILGMPDIDTIWAQDAETVFVLGGGNVQRSTDGGKTWSAPRGLIKEASWGKVFGLGLGPGGVYAVGEAGGLYFSTDGKSWEKRESGVAVSLRSVAGSAEVLYAAGDEGTLLRSLDGSRWARVALGRSENLHEVRVGAGGAYALSRGALLVHSKDGETWMRVVLEGGVAPRALWVGEKGAVAVGADGVLYAAP